MFYNENNNLFKYCWKVTLYNYSEIDLETTFEILSLPKFNARCWTELKLFVCKR